MTAMKKPIKQTKAAKPAPINPRHQVYDGPKKKTKHDDEPVQYKEPKSDMKKEGNQSVKDFINKGLAAQKAADQVIKETAAPTYDRDKQINVLLLPHESKAIDTLRALRPTSRRNAKRLAISIHDWIVEAIQEKIKRDFESNGLQLETTNGVHQESTAV